MGVEKEQDKSGATVLVAAVDHHKRDACATLEPPWAVSGGTRASETAQAVVRNGFRELDDDGLPGGVEPAEQLGEIGRVESGAACGASVSWNPEVEENARTGLGDALGIRRDDDTQFVGGHLRHVLGGMPVGRGDLRAVDEAIVIARRRVIDPFSRWRQCAVRHSQPWHRGLRVHPESFAKGKDAGGRTQIAFGFARAGVGWDR